MEFNRLTRTGIAPALTSCWRFSSECVMLRSAPVAFRCTRMSFERASLVSGTSAPDFAIFVLLSSESIKYCSYDQSFRLRIDTTTHHVWQGSSHNRQHCIGPPRLAQHLANEWFKTSQLHDEQLVVGYNSPTKEFVSVGYISDKGQFIGRHSLLTAKLPNAALAAR